MSVTSEKKCAICGARVPISAMTCSSCGKSSFETKKKHSAVRGDHSNEAPPESVDYIESPLPEGDGVCSDNACPCNDTIIPRGHGYMYISKRMVAVRSKWPQANQFYSEIEKLAADNIHEYRTLISDPSNYDARLVCEVGARKRRLDLEVAARDAKYWWSCGKVPLRPTPIKAWWKFWDSKSNESCTRDEAGYELDSVMKKWFKDPSERGSPLAPSDFNLFSLPKLSLKEWTHAIAVDPHKTHCHVVNIGHLGGVTKALFGVLKDRYGITSSQSVDLFSDFLGAACPECMGGLTGELLQTVEASRSAKGALFVHHNPGLERILNGRCANCDSQQYYIIWHGDKGR